MTHNETKEKEKERKFGVYRALSKKDESKYTDIKEISAINKKWIRLAKSERETYTDETYHREQCASIPNQINHDRHGIHL